MMNNETIANWTEIELIKNIILELPRSSGAASGFTQILVKGTFGFSNDKQKEIIEMLHRETQIINEVNRWMTVWAVSRKKQEEDSNHPFWRDHPNLLQMIMKQKAMKQEEINS